MIIFEDDAIIAGPPGSGINLFQHGTWTEVADWLYNYATSMKGATTSWLAPVASKWVEGITALVSSHYFPGDLNLELKPDPSNKGEYAWFTMPVTSADVEQSLKPYAGKRGRRPNIREHEKSIPLVKFTSAKGRTGVSFMFRDTCFICGEEPAYVDVPWENGVGQHCRKGRAVDPVTGIAVSYTEIAKNPEKYRELLAQISPKIAGQIHSKRGAKGQIDTMLSKPTLAPKPTGIVARASERPELERESKNPEDIARMITEDIHTNNGLI